PHAVLVALFCETVLLSRDERFREELHDRDGRLADEHVAFPVYAAEPGSVHPDDLGIWDVRGHEPCRQSEIVLAHFYIDGLLGQVRGDTTVMKQLIGRRDDETEPHL